MSKTSHRRRERREAYERVVGIVAKNTGGAQPALASTTSIMQIAHQAGLDREQTRTAIRAALENGDLFEWHGKLALTDEESLLEVIEDEVASEHPRRALIAKCNKLRQEATNAEN